MPEPTRYAELLGDDETVIQGVLSEFLPLCAIPHPSRREEAIARHLEKVLRSRGWTVELDGAWNLRADLPGTPGLENAPLTAIQGHTDMVCAVRRGSGYRPADDPVAALRDGDTLRTDGRSSLGADCNMGNAAALWLLTRPIPHGPLRLLLTAAEEVGLEGASRVDPAWLEGVACLINTDGFRLGDLVVSSAGGRRETYTRPLHTVLRQGSRAFRLSFQGFLGGHSGYDIHLGRANPIKLMALVLGELRETVEYELASLAGGHTPNSIPMDCSAVITLDPRFVPALARAAAHVSGQLSSLYGRRDPGGSLELAEVQPPERVWTTPCRDGTLDLLSLLYTGVYAMHDTIPDRVSASSNLGMVYADGETITVRTFLRCTVGFSEEILAFQHARAARSTGFELASHGYPGWPGEADDPLAKAMARVYRRVTGHRARITAIHAGLEPSVLRAKNPAMDIVSTGPDIFDPHSTEERVRLSSLPPYIRLLAGTLEELALRPPGGKKTKSETG